MRVLMIEDSDDDAELIEHQLRRQWQDLTLQRVETAGEMRQLLHDGLWDVILSDYSLPTFSASAALQELHESGLDIPFIVVSGTLSEEMAVDVLRAGAADFLSKGRWTRLAPAIERECRDAAGRRVRRQAEQELREVLERSAFAMHAAGIGTWEHELAAGREHWSPALEAMHGFAEGEFDGKRESLVRVVHPDDNAMVRQHIGRIDTDSDEHRITYRVVWPDRSTHWISRRGRASFRPDGTPIRAAGVGIDVTAQQEMEDHLRQAQRMESVGNLAGGVAHDFNNLLTIILGYCDLLLTDFEPADARRPDIEEIQKAGTSAAGLTRQLLAFSRKQILEPRVFDLNIVVTHMEAMLTRLIREDVTVVTALSPVQACVRADRGQIEQVIMNLAVNGRDAMPDGGTLTITTTVSESRDDELSANATPGRQVHLTVRDTGTGMSPEVLSRLFEPFFTTKELGKGTGLGLATVHGIAERCGGAVNVRSELGVGTSFEVCLPYVSSADVPVEAPSPLAMRDNGLTTIMVVDDAAGIRQLAKRILERENYSVLVAGNAAEALKHFAAHPSIDILLTDVVMPGASGPELTRQLVEQHPTLKVIYMSGYTDDAIIHHEVLNPGISFLNKPFTAVSLSRRIREVLNPSS